MTSVLPLRFPKDRDLVISDQERSFVVSFERTVRACSWAIVHGGLVNAQHVVWLEVRNSDLGPAVDPREFLAGHLRRAGLACAIGLLTSRKISTRVDVATKEGGVSARCIATVGLGNALRAGDGAWSGFNVGTINILAHIDVPLTDEGLLEANAIATEAKSAAMFDAGISSRKSGRLATGTGTDCTVVACPLPRRGLDVGAYAGKYTVVGSAIGAAVERAIARGIRDWRRDVGA